MKKIAFLFFLSFTILFTGCLETTQEVTIGPDGSGMLTNVSDLSAFMGMVKQMAGKDAGKLDSTSIDTTLALSEYADSITNISDQEKEILKKGILILNMQKDTFIVGIKFPFTELSQIAPSNELTSKILFETLKKELGASEISGMEEMPPPTSIDEYFTTKFSEGSIIKVLNKEKYATAASDEFLKGMKESAAMGMPMTATYAFNLPRPVKKVEGKSVNLSDDKKQVTIVANIDDFFNNPSKLEFNIQY